MKSKFGLDQTKTVKAGFSTPLHLGGLKVKAFVVNHVNAAADVISNVAVAE
ncbi:hypothetical protein D3C71_2131950 [compost metagenome]